MKKSRTSETLGVEIPEEVFASRKILFQLGLIIAIGFTCYLWFGILSTTSPESTLYVLDVGQGDSQLIVLADKAGKDAIKILIDGGKDRTVLNELDRALGGLNNKYIDIVIMTHTDLDHMGGLVEVAKRYDIGLFISNGREANSDAYAALHNVLAERNIPSAVLMEGDAIRYGANTLSVLSPDRLLLAHKEVNEASIVVLLESEESRVLFTGDIGFPAENALLRKYPDLSADILKVGHHGSKNSSGENFIAQVRPLVSVIGVGKNSYGHPTSRVLETLALAGSRVYRTDENGTVKLPLDRDAKVRNAEAPENGLFAAIASVLTGAYKENPFTEVSLVAAGEEPRESALVPYRDCSFSEASSPGKAPLVMNEVAWMGASTGATHEWIELRNVTGKSVNVSGWQVVNENERVHFRFPQQSVLEKEFAVLARAGANETLGFDTPFIFTGSLRNTNEGLRLYDNQCNLIDEILLSASWPAGNNKTKQTMVREADRTWSTSEVPDGTPGK